MFNQLLVYLTVRTLFCRLDSDDLYLISCRAQCGEITVEEERELLDIFVPLGQRIV